METDFFQLTSRDDNRSREEVLSSDSPAKEIRVKYGREIDRDAETMCLQILQAGYRELF